MAKSVERDFISFLKISERIEIPIYQRNYTWKTQNIEIFFDSIYKTFIESLEKKLESISMKYYVGNIITQIYNDKICQIQIIIDGQQRLTSIFLILIAIRNTISKMEINSDLKALKNEINSFLFYDEENKCEQNKRIKLNNKNNQLILEKISNHIEIDDKKSNIYKNYKHVKSMIDNYLKKSDNQSETLRNIYRSLKNTLLIDIEVTENDNPNKIFEIINTSGVKLSPSDLIKNFIFFNSVKYRNEITKLENRYSQIEKRIGEEKQWMEFFRYITPILSKKKMDLARKDSIEIYEQFKLLFEDDEVFSDCDRTKAEDINKLLLELDKHARIWKEIWNYKTTQPRAKYFYTVFKKQINTYYSLAHQLILNFGINFYDEEEINFNRNKIDNIFKLLTKFIFSLLFFSKPSKNVTREIPKLFKEFENDQNYSNKKELNTFILWLENHHGDIKLLKISNNERKQIENYIKTAPIYSIGKETAKLLLLGIENVLVDWTSRFYIEELSIEHIMPQEVPTNSDFRIKNIKELGTEDDARAFEDQVRHTLSNLTLLSIGQNSKASNSDFSIKQRWYGNSNLLLNKQLANLDKFTKEEINNRAQSMAKTFSQLWN